MTTVLSPSNQLVIAIFLTSTAFLKFEAGMDRPVSLQNDKGGRPYILHCLEVMNNVKKYNDDELSAAAVMHDILEDVVMNASSEFNAISFKEAGFSDRVLDLLDLLTKSKKDTYENYIHKISLNEDAIKIKLADLEHNMQILRLPSINQKDTERLIKYHTSYQKLSKALADFHTGS